MIKKLWELLNSSFVGLVIGVGLTLFQFWIEEKEYRIGYWVEGQTTIADMHAVEIALWNDGDLYIDRQMISSGDPLKLLTDSAVTVLSYKVLCRSRKDLRFKIKELPNGITLQLQGDDGLEKHDGIKLQIIYCGASNSKWFVTGRIKGSSNTFREYTTRQMDKFKSMPWYAMPIEIMFFLIFSWIIIMCHIYSSLNILTWSQLSDVFFSYCFYGGLLILNIIILWNHLLHAGDLEWLFG